MRPTSSPGSPSRTTTGLLVRPRGLKHTEALQINTKSFQFSSANRAGVSFITVAYAQNESESGVRDFPRQGCDL
jgi:hypothetical protein